MEILRVEHLCKVYGTGSNQVHALDDVNFSVQAGEFVAIIGPSGSGKSTLLHILGGVDVPSSGKVFVDGKDVFTQNQEQLAVFRRRQVGLIYQFYNLIPVLNVEENITLPVLLDGRKVNEERLRELLHVLGAGTAAGASAEPAFGRAAAAGIDWPRTDERARAGAGGRTDRQPRQQEQPGNFRIAAAVEPEIPPDDDCDHARRKDRTAGGSDPLD